MKKQPAFFVVGAPKSGTSFLHHHLAQHPALYIAQKELNYFSWALTYQHSLPDEETYLGYFRNARKKVLCGDISAWYLLAPHSAEAIRHYYPEARIIILLRNPIEMIPALHNQLVYTRSEQYRKLMTAFEAEPARRQGKGIPAPMHSPQEGLYYSSVAKYSEQVQRYQRVFPEDQLLILLFDELQDNQAEFYRKVLKFLEVKTDFQPEFKQVNPAKSARSAKLAHITNHPPGLMKRVGNWLFPYGSERRANLFSAIYKLNMKKTGPITITDEERQWLLNSYKDDIESLQSLIRTDLSHWIENDQEHNGHIPDEVAR